MFTTALLLALAPAHAQEEPPPEVPEAPVAPEAEPVPEPPLAVRATPVAPAPRKSFRFGAGGGLGAFVPGPSVTFHGSLRMGVQLKPSLGIYGEMGGIAGLGLGVSADGQQARASGVLLSYLAPMIEYDQGAFFVAGGPMLARGAWAYAKADNTGNGSATAFAAGGSILPGLQGRTGFTLGSNNGQRGTTIALDAKMFIARGGRADDDGTTSSARSVTSVGFMPTIYIGWDLR